MILTIDIIVKIHLDSMTIPIELWLFELGIEVLKSLILDYRFPRVRFFVENKITKNRAVRNQCPEPEQVRWKKSKTWDIQFSSNF